MRTLVLTPEWATAIEAFKAELIAAGRPRTTRRLRVYHIRSLAHDYRDRSPWDLTRTDLVNWIARHEHWKPNTRHSTRSSLRVFYQWAQFTGHTETDPAATLPRITAPLGQPRPAPDPVVDKALRAASTRTRLMIAILVLTGIRVGELAQLHTDDILQTPTGWALRIHGKGGRERHIPIEEQLANTLLRLPPGWMFPGPKGHLTAGTVCRLVSRALPDGWTGHTLRHRFATLAYAVERDLRAVQELLGHSKITTTQVYTFVPDESMRRAASAAKHGLMSYGTRATAPPTEVPTPRVTTIPQTPTPSAPLTLFPTALDSQRNP